jgi:hypothetical protein
LASGVRRGRLRVTLSALAFCAFGYFALAERAAPSEHVPAYAPSLRPTPDAVDRAIKEAAPARIPLPTSTPNVRLATPPESLRTLASAFFVVAYFVCGFAAIALCRALSRFRGFDWVAGAIVVLPFVPLLVVAFILWSCYRAIRFLRTNAPVTAKKRRAVTIATASAVVVTIVSAVLFKSELEEFAAAQHRAIVAIGHFDFVSITSAVWAGLRTACVSGTTPESCTPSLAALGSWYGTVGMTLAPSGTAALVWIAMFFWSFGVGTVCASETKAAGYFWVLPIVQLVATLLLVLLLVPLRAIALGELYAVWCAFEVLLGCCGLWYIGVSATVFHGFETLRLIRERYSAVVEELKS